MKIKTNKAMRGFYLKHLAKLDDYANGNFEDNNCYMCESAKFPRDSVLHGLSGNCDVCPLGVDASLLCDSDLRSINLRTANGMCTDEYTEATPKSIRKHIKWMEKQINDKTNCLIYYE